MTEKRYCLLVLWLILLFGKGFAQESTSVFNFLNLPYSAHATALGGHSISLVEDDISLAAQNPALLSSVTDKTVGLNFMTYMQGCKMGGASYAQMLGERGTWGAYAQFASYGSITEMTEAGELMGTFSPLDLCLAGQYSYMLGECWVGGATGKFIYSHYGEFTSCALAVDLGLNYFLDEKDLSVSLAARNLGGQVKCFADHHEKLPFDLELGFTKGLGHAPISISVTMVDLTRWGKKNYFTTDEKISGGRVFTNHFVVGVDVLPAKMIYISGGFNFRRAYELKAAGSSHAAGLSAGAGLNLDRLKVGLAYAKYHVGAPTFSFTLAYNFQKKN